MYKCYICSAEVKEGQVTCAIGECRKDPYEDTDREKKLKADILKVIDEADKNEGWVLRHVIENKLLGYYSRAEIDRVLMKSFYLQMLPGGIFYVKEANTVKEANMNTCFVCDKEIEDGKITCDNQRCIDIEEKYNKDQPMNPTEQESVGG